MADEGRSRAEMPLVGPPGPASVSGEGRSRTPEEVLAQTAEVAEDLLKVVEQLRDTVQAAVSDDARSQAVPNGG